MMKSSSGEKSYRTSRRSADVTFKVEKGESWLPGPQRRRQDHHHADDHGRAAAHLRLGPGGRVDVFGTRWRSSGASATARDAARIHRHEVRAYPCASSAEIKGVPRNLRESEVEARRRQDGTANKFVRPPVIAISPRTAAARRLAPGAAQ